MPEDIKNALLPVYLVLDTSASMAGKFDAAISFLSALYGELMKKADLADKLRVKVITFDEKTAVFVPSLSDMRQLEKYIEKLKMNPIVPKGSMTNYGKAFSKLKTEIESGVLQLKKDKYEVYRPCSILITGGNQTDNDSAGDASYSRLTASSFEDRPNLICIGVGEAAKENLRKYGAGVYKYNGQYITGNEHMVFELRHDGTPAKIVNAFIDLLTQQMNPEKTENDTISNKWVQGLPYESQLKDIGGFAYIMGEKVGAANEIPRIAEQPNKNIHRSDWISDIAQIDDLTIMATSMRGSSHYGLEMVRQDAYAIGSAVDLNEDNLLIAAIADGVSASKRSHAIADYMVRQTILVVAEFLRNSKMSFEKNYWENLSKKLVEISVEYCKSAARRLIQPSKNIDIDTIDMRAFAENWATTLEYAIVQTKKRPDAQTRKFVHISVAGDGSAYIINETKGWNIVKPGKRRSGGLVSNAVSALPFAPETCSIKFGTLSAGDCLLMVTDGLGDIIRNGDTQIGGFFQRNYPKCEYLLQFLHVSSIAMRQADDDRTVILIKQH
jgi:uncharacterized protein YegL/serine/threonine protein phosphatase PrpC